MNESLWTKEKLPSFPALDGDAETDVLIIGGGLAGLLTAYQMTQAGIDTLLIEANTLLSGVSMNTTAKITSQHALIYSKLIREFGEQSARLYYEANENALSRYRELSREISCEFEEKDAYVYGVSDSRALDEELAALRRIGVTADFVSTLPLPFPVRGAIRFEHQAQFHPLKFAAGIAKGLSIREHTTALAFEPHAVLTNRGRIRAKHIVVATHFPLINKHGGYFLKLYQDRSYVIALKDAPDLHGMYIDAAQDGLSFRNAGEYLLIGGGAHRTGKAGRGFEAPESFAGAHYPRAQKVCRWATQDCMTLDGVPYIGPYSAHTPGLYVAAGFNKWGMTSSMVAAQLLRDLVLERKNPYADLFSPARSMLRAQLAANALEAAASLLTFTRPRCPHMGCALKWNAQEHSWDCPCHGSRFSEDGKLLNNPSTGALTRTPPPPPEDT